MTVEGAVDAEVFRSYVEQVLGPPLRPGAIGLRDNLAVPKVTDIASTIRACGARVEDLPPYSPELNPIEKCWAKLKTAFRQVKARTREAREEALTQALQTISAADVRAWFTHCGYPAH
jgi:transposase